MDFEPMIMIYHDISWYIMIIHWMELMEWLLVYILDRPFSTHVLVDIEHQVDARSPADSWTPLLAVAGLSRSGDVPWVWSICKTDVCKLKYYVFYMSCKYIHIHIYNHIIYIYSIIYITYIYHIYIYIMWICEICSLHSKKNIDIYHG